MGVWCCLKACPREQPTLRQQSSCSGGLRLTLPCSPPCRDAAGNNFDLSSLSRYSDNWEAVTSTGAPEHYLINVCKSLAPQPGAGEDECG